MSDKTMGDLDTVEESLTRIAAALELTAAVLARANSVLCTEAYAAGTVGAEKSHDAETLVRVADAAVTKNGGYW
jgi:hypothetical protein